MRTLLFATLLVLGARARAETPTWVPDRPNATVAPVVLPLGYVGLDIGLRYEGDRPGDEDRLSVPIKLRYPVTARWELQVTASPLDWEDPPHDDARMGVSDLAVASRTVLTEGGGWRPPLALELGATIPTGSIGLGSGSPSFYALLATEITPWEAVWLDLNLGLSLEPLRGVGRGFVADEFASAALGLDLAGLALPYLELSWAAAHAEPGADFLQLELGTVWFVTERVALDAIVSTGLTAPAPDLAVAFGVSVLLER
ncbi:MAG: hypothetical protein D6776_10470 [Planctomycetota bacterium]|nr:MAG: hypothetical protein D6776_10470 [Planctomycetota bacterium]